MTMQEELAALVNVYAKLDTEKHCYSSKLDKEELLRLDADFIKLINKRLLITGPEKEKLKANYKKLVFYFHPDRELAYLPEVVWLEQNLLKGTCFKTLHTCYEKLTTPHKFKEFSINDIKTRSDCKKWLESLKDKAGTYTARCFWESLIGLLDESGGFFDEVGKITPKGLRTLLTFMPMIFASYGTIIFAEELIALHALYFIVLKGGQYLSSSDYIEIKALGKTLQQMTLVTATATTILLVRLLEMTFWASRQCFDISLRIGSSLLKPLLTAPTTSKVGEAPVGSNFCKDLVLANQNLTAGIQFKTPELKVIAAPLEAYKGLNAQQFLLGYRSGYEKGKQVDAFLFRLRVIDKDTKLIGEKLIAAQKALQVLKDNKEVYTKGGKTAEAVDCADELIALLIKSEPSAEKTAKEAGSVEKAITDLVVQDAPSSAVL